MQATCNHNKPFKTASNSNIMIRITITSSYKFAPNGKRERYKNLCQVNEQQLPPETDRSYASCYNEL